MCRSASQHHGLGFQVRQHRVRAALTADAGLLEATECDVEIHPGAVLPHGPGSDPACYAVSLLEVVREHRTVETEYRVIRQSDGLFDVAIRNDADHRTEDLFLGNRRAIVYMGKDRRFEEIAAGEAGGP